MDRYCLLGSFVQSQSESECLLLKKRTVLHGEGEMLVAPFSYLLFFLHLASEERNVVMNYIKHCRLAVSHRIQKIPLNAYLRGI